MELWELRERLRPEAYLAERERGLVERERLLLDLGLLDKRFYDMCIIDNKDILMRCSCNITYSTCHDMWIDTISNIHSKNKIDYGKNNVFYYERSILEVKDQKLNIVRQEK